VALDYEQFMDLSSTIKAVSHHIQEVNHALAQEKLNRHEQLNQLIIQVTKTKVSDKVWKEIVDEANERLKRNQL
jgi:hypothetical protein